jgi:hypothetical protein
MAISPYCYHILPSDPPTIQVLELQPPPASGESPNDLSITLSSVALTNAPAYEALSYCWGDATSVVTIECNRSRLTITKGLSEALIHLRHQNTPRRLWVDAICINQLDINGKNCQVPLMQDVFKKAKRVLIWLGEEENDSEILAEAIPQLLEYEKLWRAAGETRNLIQMSSDDREVWAAADGR